MSNHSEEEKTTQPITELYTVLITEEWLYFQQVKFIIWHICLAKGSHVWSEVVWSRA